ncbi:cytochrome P450 [Umbelopsis sp. AD052]|nr:cytochrome P450 [Umbelopsis sp. AD052]
MRNPFPGVPKTEANLLDMPLYDRKRRDEKGEMLPPLEQLNALGSTLIVVNDPKLATSVLVEGQNKYLLGHKVGRSPIMADFHSMLIGGENIGNARGAGWRWRRDVLVPQFQPRKLVSQVLPSIIQKSKDLIDHVKSHNGNPVDIDKYFVELTGNVICEYLFGEVPQPGEVLFDNFRRTDVIFLSFMLRPIFQFFGWKGPGAREINNNRRYVQRMMDKIRSGNGQQPGGSPPLMEQLMKLKVYQGKQGEEHLINDMLLMIFAGHDTTAHSLTYLVYGLTQELSVQKKIREEVTGQLPDLSAITPSSLSKLTYTSAAIKENMRIHPPVTVAMHEAYDDYMIDKTLVPKGTTIVISTARINQHPEIFKQPLAFLPERWLAEDEDMFNDLEANGADKGLMNSTYLTFSKGTHLCLGMNLAYLEMRIVISYLVTHFNITYDGPIPQTVGMIVAPKDEILFNFQPINA